MEKIRIGDVGDVITGKTPKTSVPEYYGDEFPFVTPADFRRLKSISRTEKSISTLGMESIGKSFIPAHSICVTCIGSDMGKVSMVEMDCATNQQINSVVPYDNYDNDYIYYAIKFVSPTIKHMGSSSTAVPIVNKTDFSNVLIYCPPLKSNQIKIARLLRCYDNKIEKNLDSIALLEKYIQALYQSWFSDFNYPNATSEMRKSENLHTEVPKEWDETKFGDFLLPCSEKIGDIEAPIYSTTNNGITLRDEKFNKNLSKSHKNNKKIVKDDLIFGLSREILNFGVVTAEIGSVSPVYQVFKINQSVFLPFMLELEIRINMRNYMDILRLGAREGQGISKDYLLNKYILVPDMEVQKQFEKIYTVIQNKIAKLKEENIVLAEISDTLLPKLMSGELPVEVGEA